MQFTTKGPDIPDALLQAQEEGRVVFFCGAGISYPAGLPGFKGLVEEIYRLNGTIPTAIEQEALKYEQFSAALDLLERRLPGQRLAVRSKLAQVLKPKLRRKGAVDTHAALLRLARNREGALRLVTTNFDRVFHSASKRIKQPFQAFAAPMLPIPKSSRWDGLVYLHGLLPKTLDEMHLNRLVITSGDFGLAYLTERWAARFVTELFRSYVVCFVGYSINDPVLRYMMDALAADRMLGEVTPEAWALGDCEPGNEDKKTIEWEAKGVTPILYEVPTGSHDHSALHQTLHVWAETHRDGVQGKESIIVKHASVQPQNSTQQDDFIGRMLWALSDKSGLPAKRFAEFNPVPSLDWLLDVFSINRFGHIDLMRFDVPPRDVVDANLNFSLVSRPAPYDLAPHMLLSFGSPSSSQWDGIMHHLGRWLIRHLDDPRLILWIAHRGGRIHESWRRLIERKLDELASLERDGKTLELAEIRSNAPKAVPGRIMQMLWRLVLTDRMKSYSDSLGLFSWKRRLKREGMSVTLRLELRELLSPRVTLKKPFRLGGGNLSINESAQIEYQLDTELVLAVDNVHSELLRDSDIENWNHALPQLLDDFQQLLLDALDLLKELGNANDLEDGSHWGLPSIKPHWQNRGFHDWVSLIELLRDAWLEVRAKDRKRATRIAQAWFTLPYPTFKRLALFASSYDDCISPKKWTACLLADGNWWLWSIETRREVFRLFVSQGMQLTGNNKKRLEAAILAGPPREMYQDDLEPDRWRALVARSVWLHLSKLSSSGLMLGSSAAKRLIELSNDNPSWKLTPNESDEFSHWMSGTGDPDYEASRDMIIAPRKRHDLSEWLKNGVAEGRPFFEDNWGEVCRTRFFHSLGALCDLAREDIWQINRWREALQAWSDEEVVQRSWRYAAPLVRSMPDQEFRKIVSSAAWWIKSASKQVNSNDSSFIELCQKVLEHSHDTHDYRNTESNNAEQNRDIVGDSINHPVGYISQALMNAWFIQNPNDNELIPSNIKAIFTELCDTEVDNFRHGRVILGSQLIALFRVDREWTEQYLLPLFNWKNPSEARAVWEGFLWSPRLFQPLLMAIKSQFLDSANHYDELGEHRHQFAKLLTYAALEKTQGYTVEEFRSAISSLPQDGLEQSATALYQATEAAANQREDYWKNRTQPFWHEVWPKSGDLATPRIAEILTRLAIAARGKFPSALDAFQAWLKPVEYPHYVVHKLLDSGLCKRFPEEALGLLNAIIGDQSRHPNYLRQCLDEIVEASPQLVENSSYLRLRTYLRRREE